jgi:hypothetical protein
MKFIVEPEKQERQEGVCPRATTLCALCSEDPRFCEHGQGPHKP